MAFLKQENVYFRLIFYNVFIIRLLNEKTEKHNTHKQSTNFLISVPSDTLQRSPPINENPCHPC